MDKVMKVLGAMFSFLSAREANRIEDKDDIGKDIKEVRKLRREMNRLVRKKLLSREEAQLTVKVLIANIRKKKNEDVRISE